MLGLPRRYQLTVWVTGLLTFTVIGATVVRATGVPLVWPSGAAAGAVLGALAVLAFVKGLSRSAPAPRSAEVQRQRPVVGDR